MVCLRVAEALIKMGQAEARDRAVCKVLIEIAKGVEREDWSIKDSQVSRKWLTVPEDEFMEQLKMRWRCSALIALEPLRNQLSKSEIQELIAIGMDLVVKEKDWYSQGQLLSTLVTFRDQLSKSQVQELIAVGEALIAKVRNSIPSVRKHVRQTVEPAIRQLQREQ